MEKEMVKAPKITRLVAGAIPTLLLWNPSAETVTSVDGESTQQTNSSPETVISIDGESIPVHSKNPPTVRSIPWKYMSLDHLWAVV